jgi:hypothetical protein
VKKTTGFVLALLAAAGLGFGDVVKTSKSEIAFKKFGTFSTSVTAKLAGDKMLSETDGTFKGRGLLGNLAKAFLRSGKTGELIDLGGQTLTSVDYKKKEYTVTPFAKWAEDRKKAMDQANPQAEKPAESGITIIRSEFKVEKSAETKAINGFDCVKYLAALTVEWENVSTREKGADKLETAVWTTPLTADLKTAQAEEMGFYAAFLKGLGMDFDKLEGDILGTEWLTLMASLDPMGGGARMKPDKAAVAAQMKKIEGFPIVVDGKYYPAPRPKAAEQAEESGGGVGGALGRLGKSILSKKPDPEEEKAPALAFYSEIISVNTAAVDPATLQTPANFKKK